MVEVVGIRVEVEEDAAVRAFRRLGRAADTALDGIERSIHDADRALGGLGREGEQELGRIERAAKDADRAVERVGKEGGISLGKLAGAATAAWAAFQGAQEVVGFLADGVDAASNYAESLSKLEVIVGDVAASDLADWAESAATTIGATSDQALEMTGTMANLLKTVGTAPDQIGPMSADIVELGADLASFHNVAGGTPEVLEKIRAGLVGEAEPLRTLGVLLSAARVEEEAYASGIAERGQKLTEAQKVQARYNIILKDTADAQGDFARTSDGLANSQRILQANIGNLQREIGERLTPVVADAVSALNGLFTSEKEEAVADYRRQVTDLERDLRAINPAASTTEIKVEALFRAFNAADDAKNLVGDLIGELNGLGLTFDDLNRRQQELIAKGLSPALDDIADKVNDLAETSWWEGALDFIANDGPLSKIVAGWLGANESVEEYRRSLLEFESYIPTLNAVLDRYGQKTETTLGLSIELWGANADEVEDVERRIAASLRATGLYTEEEANNIAQAWVRSAQESNRAEESRRTALAESETQTRDYAIEVGQLESVTGDAIPTFDTATDGIADMGGAADEAEEPVSALAKMMGLDDTTSLGGAAEWAEGRIADLVTTLQNLDGTASTLDLLKARAELFALAGAALAADAQARGLDAFLAGQEAFDTAAFTAMRITQIELDTAAVQNLANVFTGGGGGTTTTTTTSDNGKGGGSDDTPEWIEFYNALPASIVNHAGKRATDSDRDSIASAALGIYRADARAKRGPSIGKSVAQAVAQWQQRGAPGPKSPEEQAREAAEAAQAQELTDIRGIVDTGLAGYTEFDWRARRNLAGRIQGRVDEWQEEFPGRTADLRALAEPFIRELIRTLGALDFEGDPDTSQDLQEDDVFDGDPKPGTIGGDLIDAVDNLYDLPEGVEAMANLRTIMAQGTDDQRSYFQMLHDDLAEDGFTQQEIKMLLEQSGPIVTAIEAGRADAKAAAASQAALQIRALEEGGIQLYNALVEGGVIDAPLLDAPEPDRGPEAPVFTRADGTRYVQVGSALKGYRNVELSQAAITAAGAERLALNQHAYGDFPGLLDESDRETQRSINAALTALVRWQERDTRANEQTAANTAGGYQPGPP